MADGLLLILSGKTTHDRKMFEKLPKTYKCRALFGFQTDSYDILGMFTETYSAKRFDITKLQQAITQFIGKQNQAYPPFSSPRVKGHPLFWWAREGRLDEITIPTKNIEIFSIDLLHTQHMGENELSEEIITKLHSVSGEFRQEEIIEQWKMFFQNRPSEGYIVAELEVSCSSGTYIRSLINEVGKKLGTGALALSITRTAIGDFTLEQALTLD
jgi:tRNA pseudouridine55 synthase